MAEEHKCPALSLQSRRVSYVARREMQCTQALRLLANVMAAAVDCDRLAEKASVRDIESAAPQSPRCI